MDDLDEITLAEMDNLGPAEWAFDTLLKIAAYGLDRSKAKELRRETLEAVRRHRAANGTCPGCGHEPHEPEVDHWWRQCSAPRVGYPDFCGCSATRLEDGTVKVGR